jgi:EpsI family protein
LGTTSYIHFFSVEPISLSKNLQEIPKVLSGWRASKNESHIEPHFGIQGADNVLTRLYHDSSGYEIMLQIGYFEFQRQGKELAYYTLQDIYYNSRPIEIQNKAGNTNQINMAQVQINKSEFLVFYWYNIDGKNVASNIMTKLYTAVNGFFLKKTNGAMIIISMEKKKNKNEADYFNRALEFIHEAAPIIDEYLPPNNIE